MITNQQVFTSMQGVLAEIVRAANEVTDPNPTPPLKGGEWLRKVQAKETTAQVGFLMNKLARPYSVPKALRAEIESLRNNVQVILKDATTSYNVSTAALGVKYGIQGIRWGIGGVVVSCAIYATSTYLASDDHSTEKLIEGMKKDVILQDSATIKREADSIKESIDKLDKRLDKVEKALKSNPPKRKVMTR